MFPNRAALALVLSCVTASALTAQAQKGRPEDTEVWTPVPRVVTPGRTNDAPPSDAIVLFDGRNLDEWVSVKDHGPAAWMVSDGVLTVNKSAGNIESRSEERRVGKGRGAGW